MASLFGQIQINKEDVSCYGGDDGSIQVTVANTTDPVTYKWNDGLSGRNRIGLSAGTYTVTITDATNCDKVRTIEIMQPAKPLTVKIQTAPSGIIPECNEVHPVNVLVTADGGTPPYTVNGSPNNFNIQLSESQWFTGVAVDDKGCTAQKKRVILVGTRLCPRDPNDVLGPGGVGTERWVARSDTLDYTIRFENDPVFAMAPAQRVFITQEFDEEINPFSFRVGTFGFGDLTFDVPRNVAQFQRRYDLTADYGVLLDVVAGLDIANNRAFWSLVAIDPLTGLQPTDPLVGFLPVNDTLTGSGEGFVTFSVKPVSTAQTGDTAEVQASIVFNVNEPIVTNNWSNLIDALPPTTNLEELDPDQESDTIELSWTGADDPGGSGIREFELYMSVDSMPFEQLVSVGGDAFSYDFVGVPGTHYSFYLVGIDSVENKELKSPGEASISILPRQAVVFDDNVEDTYCRYDSIMLNWTAVLVDSVDLLLRIDSDELVVLASRLDSSTTSYIYPLPDSLGGELIRFFIVASDSMSIIDSSNQILVVNPPLVEAGPDTTLCPGDFIYLGASGANSYHWSPQVGLNSQSAPIQYLTVDTTQKYFLTGTDIYGCFSTDSITVSAFPIPVDSLYVTICEGDSVFVGGEWRDSTGVFEDIETSINGCDSIVITSVELVDPCVWPGGPIAYVDSSATGENTGHTWEDAFTDLQDAFAAARKYVNIEEIWIAEGTYYTASDTDRSMTFLMQDSMQVYGGFQGTETLRTERLPGINPVLLHGDIGVIGDSLDNAYHVVTVDTTCFACNLDGVTIAFGTANGASPDEKVGAGVISFGSARLSNVVVERNSSEAAGAAIYNTGPLSVLAIENCVIRLNTSAIGEDVVNIQSASLKIEGENRVEDD